MTAHNIDIIATIGRSSGDYETIKSMIEAGANIFRITFSHHETEDHIRWGKLVRQVAKDMGREDEIRILADIQGPKFRIGTFKVGTKMPIQKGQIITFDNNPEPGDETRISLLHPEILDALEPGMVVKFQSGRVEMRVIQSGDGSVKMEVLKGTLLNNRTGVSVPGLQIDTPVLTEKDKVDIETALSDDIKADMVAISFVQNAESVRCAQGYVRDRSKIISKIETQAALNNLDEIIAASDGVMVARGDLGVEIPEEDVPFQQERIMQAANKAGKYKIIATHVLETMKDSEAPNRAEIDSIYHGVKQGADAFMLSEETGAGQYPVQVVSMLNRAISRALELLSLHPESEARSFPNRDVVVRAWSPAVLRL